MKLTRETEMEKVRHRAEDAAEDRILDTLLPMPESPDGETGQSDTRQKFRKMLREGKLDDKEIEIELEVSAVGDHDASGHEVVFQAFRSDRSRIAGRLQDDMFTACLDAYQSHA